ncbi:hypothetical protein [Sphingomonas aracearum]|uniref:Oligosaccharide biosynthesis protein Alg14 n=1 Tax=Sphingomonas aracearum TaxID=2283317 RepID=A0A369VWT8_9SPHN|nr:hypothetical protein [Sphingomonas aracearum]RDE06309.1 hypothetical protein DVW87_00835 [Sphingomonas aracearum]
MNSVLAFLRQPPPPHREARPRPAAARRAPRRQRLLACASGGGHWIELRRLRPAFGGLEVTYVSTLPTYAETVPGNRYHCVPDTSRFDLASLVPNMLRAAWIIARERPAFVVTTGSAPMLAFVLLGRLNGARTLWIDSVANSEHLSTSGRVAKRLAHRCIAQWPNVAADERIEHWGSVL